MHCPGCKVQSGKVVCNVKSDFVNLDFTRTKVAQQAVSNGNNNEAADEERYRPNYMTGERCGKERGCVPCDQSFTELNTDGCLVPMKTGPQEWFGLTTSHGSDMITSSATVEFKCNHTGQVTETHE